MGTTMKTDGLKELMGLLTPGPLPVDEVLAKVPESALDLAWSAGLVEFGRRPTILTGRPEHDMSQSTFIVESEDPTVREWSGAKTPGHGGLAAVLADSKSLPKVGRYLTYKLLPDETGEMANEKVPITEAEARAALGLTVRLTDHAAKEAARAAVREALGLPVRA